jgi:hypothetical protein
MNDEEKELFYARNLRNWVTSSKDETVEIMQELDGESAKSQMTFFDSRYPDHTFELSLKARKRSQDD